MADKSTKSWVTPEKSTNWVTAKISTKTKFRQKMTTSTRESC